MRRWKKSVAYIVLIISLVFTLFPLYWIVNTALKFEGDNLHKPPYFIPPKITFENFRMSITGHGEFQGVAASFPSILLSIRHSLLIALANLSLVLVVGCLAAYSIARFGTGGKNFSFWILSNRFLPPVVFIIPLFLVLRTLGLLDTHVALILLYSSFNLPFLIWFLIGYFSEIPREIEEAALVDGCSRLGTLWKIVIPLSAPGIIAVSFFCFLFAWNEYIFAFILAGREVITLPVALPRLSATYHVLRGMIAASSIIAIIPAVILTIFFRRFIVRGLSMGAVKG